MVNEALASGHEIVTIPNKLKEKIRGGVDISGDPIKDLSQFIQEYSDSFEFKFVNVEQLTASERKVFNMTDQILDLIGGKPSIIKDIAISETMKKDETTFREADGVWIGTEGKVIVKRTVLEGIQRYAAVLLHELAHAKSSAADCSRDFENQLTDFLGQISLKILKP